MPDFGPLTEVDVEKIVVITMLEHDDVLTALVVPVEQTGNVTVGVTAREEIMPTNLLLHRFGEVHVLRFLQQHFES